MKLLYFIVYYCECTRVPSRCQYAFVNRWGYRFFVLVMVIFRKINGEEYFVLESITFLHGLHTSTIHLALEIGVVL